MCNKSHGKWTLVGTSIHISIQQHFNCAPLRRCMHPVPLYQFNFYQATSDLSVSNRMWLLVPRWPRQLRAHTCETICIRLRTPDIYQFIKFYTSRVCSPFIETITPSSSSAAHSLVTMISSRRQAKRIHWSSGSSQYFYRNSFGIRMRNANFVLSRPSSAISRSLVSLCATQHR